MPPSQDRDLRRSRRIDLPLQLDVLSLAPSLEYIGHCHATNVSYHGCQFIAPRPFRHETLLRLNVLSTPNRKTMARVIWSIPVWSETPVSQWKVGVQLEVPGDYWNPPMQPDDWPTAG